MENIEIAKLYRLLNDLNKQREIVINQIVEARRSSIVLGFTDEEKLLIQGKIELNEIK